MREVVDESTGAILFKSDAERDPVEKRIKNLEHTVKILSNSVKLLTEELKELKSSLNK